MKLTRVATAVLACMSIGPSLAWGQCATFTTSTIKNCNGIDYELWNQNNKGTVSMQITGGSTNPNGGTFSGTWNGTENILIRAGKKWGASSTTTARSLKNISLDFAATWSSGDNVKMLGIYGWAYYPSGSSPTKAENGQSMSFSNQIEYYIIQDRGSYNAASGGTNSKKYGEGTIDNIVYEFYIADRINQPMLTGNGNFKQYFSVPKSTASHRQSGTVSVYKHFEAWDKANMKMLDCALYEVAMKVESYTGSATGKGSANVTKNLLTLGGPVGISRDVNTGASNLRLTSLKGRTLFVWPVDAAPFQYRIVDVNGVVKAEFNASTESSFSLSTLPAGLYVLDVKGAGIKQSKPIVLQ